MHHKFIWPSFDFHFVILWSVYEFHVTIIWPFNDLHGTIIWPLKGIYIMTFKVFRWTQNVGQWPLHENKVLTVWMLMFLYWFYGGTRLTRQIVSHMTRPTTKKAPPSGLKNLSKNAPKRWKINIKWKWNKVIFKASLHIHEQASNTKMKLELSWHGNIWLDKFQTRRPASNSIFFAGIEMFQHLPTVKNETTV